MIGSKRPGLEITVQYISPAEEEGRKGKSFTPVKWSGNEVLTVCKEREERRGEVRERVRQM